MTRMINLLPVLVFVLQLVTVHAYDACSSKKGYDHYVALSNSGAAFFFGGGSQEREGGEQEYRRRRLQTGFSIDFSVVWPFLQSGVASVSSTLQAFAALKDDGSVVTWGESWTGGDSSSTGADLSSGVVEISATTGAFAARKNDGSVVAWGDADTGGDTTRISALLVDVESICANDHAFAGRTSTGAVVAWGSQFNGGWFNYGATSARGILDSGVVEVYSSAAAFAALKNDGSVVAWGLYPAGDVGSNPAAAAQLTSGVVDIVATNNAFCAQKSDGTVVCWGLSAAITGADTVTNVVKIFSTEKGFAALRGDGSVVSWGVDADSSNVATELDGTVDVVTCSTTFAAFACLRTDGHVISFGDAAFGGDSSAVSAKLQSGIHHVFSNAYAFAALADNGALVVWGNTEPSGPVATNTIPLSSVQSKLTSGVANVFTSSISMVALKFDGSLVAFGSALGGFAEISSRLEDITHVSSNTEHNTFSDSAPPECVLLETAHPYAPNTKEVWTADFPGTGCYRVEMSARSWTPQPSDFLQLVGLTTGAGKNEVVRTIHGKTRLFKKRLSKFPTVDINADSLEVRFNSDGDKQSYGVRSTVCSCSHL